MSYPARAEGLVNRIISVKLQHGKFFSVKLQHGKFFNYVQT